MAHSFDDVTQSAVLTHMNDDHAADSVLIVRAFGAADQLGSVAMVGFDGAGGTWVATDDAGRSFDVVVPWLGGHITERREVRREIVALYDEACRLLGETPRPH